MFIDIAYIFSIAFSLLLFCIAMRAQTKYRAASAVNENLRKRVESLRKQVYGAENHRRQYDTVQLRRNGLHLQIVSSSSVHSYQNLLEIDEDTALALAREIVTDFENSRSPSVEKSGFN